MSETNNEYKKLILELEKRIQKLEEKEKLLTDRLNALQHVINDIEEDIYEDGCDCDDDCGCDDDCNCSEFDFEIVCPYCSSEFVTDLSMINQDANEIRCPECNNIIELDWNEEDEDGCCSGSCLGCHGCSEDSNEEQDDDM